MGLADKLTLTAESAADVTAQIESLTHASALTAAQLSFLLQSKNLRLVQHAIALFVRDGISEPDELQEHGLRLELQEHPFDFNLCFSLVALLARTGRPPLPDPLQIPPGERPLDLSGLEGLLQAGDEHARSGNTLHLYAALWQACTRYPQTARGWAEFARALADRRDWSSCRIAADYVLKAGSCDELTAKATISALRTLVANGEIGTLDWAAWIEQLPPPLHAAVLKLQIESLTHASALTATQLSFLLQSKDLRLVQHAIALFVRDGISQPDELQEHGLRLELQERPRDFNLCLSLIALLLRMGRPPLPDPLQPGDAPQDLSGLEDLLQAGDQYARGDETMHLYAALWQACIRYPQTTRGWAEFARALADRREWSSCRIAVEYVLKAGACDELTAKAALAALSTLAANGEIGALDWSAWTEQLPPPLRSHPSIGKICFSTNNRGKLARLVPQVISAWPQDAETWMTASVDACERDKPQEAYEHIRRAFELDPIATLRFVTGDFGERFSLIVYQLNKYDDIADYLSERSHLYEDMNVVTSSPAPEAKLAVQRLRQAALERGLPSVLLVTQGKNASTSVGSIFQQGFALPTICYSLVNIRVISPWLQDYLRGGACYVTHLRPSSRNIDLLRAAGTPSVIVHVRDPRQWVISATEHARLYPNLTTRSARERRSEGFASALDYNIASLPETIAWIDGWVQAREKLTVHFTTFRDFVENRDRFVDQMLSYYGGDSRFFDRKMAFERQPGVDYRFRLGSADEWKTVLKPQQVEQINNLIPSEFWKLFGWQP